jgi:hypothetical protein
MMLKRTMDASFLNSIANNPEVRPHLGGNGPLDLSGFLRNPENVGLQGEHGGFVVTKLEHGVYECHSMFLPEARGIGTKEAMTEGLRYMFVNTDCIEIVTKAPQGNKAAFGAARGMGFVTSFHLDQGWPVEDGQRIGMDCMRLPLSKWIERDPTTEEKGKWFHDRLEELTTAIGKTIPAHYDEPAHNRAVGASVLMFQAGNTVKAAASYNLWAKIAGFPVIRLLSLNPVIVDMDQVVVGIADNDMEVLSCP